MSEEKSLILYYRKRDSLILLSISALMIIGGYLAITHDKEIIGWLNILLFSFLAIVSAINILKPAYIRLFSEGIETVSIFGRKLLKWNDVQNFYIMPKPSWFDKLLSFNLSENFLGVNYSLTYKDNVFPFGIPKVQGMTLEELAELLNSWQKKSSKVTPLIQKDEITPEIFHKKTKSLASDPLFKISIGLIGIIIIGRFTLSILDSKTEKLISEPPKSFESDTPASYSAYLKTDRAKELAGIPVYPKAEIFLEGPVACWQAADSNSFCNINEYSFITQDVFEEVTKWYAQSQSDSLEFVEESTFDGGVYGWFQNPKLDFFQTKYFIDIANFKPNKDQLSSTRISYKVFPAEKTPLEYGAKQLFPNTRTATINVIDNQDGINTATINIPKGFSLASSDSSPQKNSNTNQSVIFSDKESGARIVVQQLLEPDISQYEKWNMAYESIDSRYDDPTTTSFITSSGKHFRCSASGSNQGFAGVDCYQLEKDLSIGIVIHGRYYSAENDSQNTYISQVLMYLVANSFRFNLP